MKHISHSKKNLVLLLTLGFVFFSLKSFSQQQKPLNDTLLNGKIFTIELTEDVGSKNPRITEDDISFKADKFKAKMMTKDYQFKSAAYTAKMDAATGKIEFEATIKNPDDALITWTGTVKGEEIEGSAEWVKKNGVTKMMYTFTGSIKKPKSKKSEKNEK